MQTVSVMYVSESQKIINANGKTKSRMINLNLRGGELGRPLQSAWAQARYIHTLIPYLLSLVFVYDVKFRFWRPAKGLCSLLPHPA